jgi:hypothetical protein
MKRGGISEEELLTSLHLKFSAFVLYRDVLHQRLRVSFFSYCFCIKRCNNQRQIFGRPAMKFSEPSM